MLSFYENNQYVSYITENLTTSIETIINTLLNLTMYFNKIGDLHSSKNRLHVFYTLDENKRSLFLINPSDYFSLFEYFSIFIEFTNLIENVNYRSFMFSNSHIAYILDLFRLNFNINFLFYFTVLIIVIILLCIAVLRFPKSYIVE